MTIAPKIPIQISANLNVQERKVLPRSPDTIPNTAHSVNKGIDLLTVHLAADAPNIDINDIGCRIKTKIPDMLQQHRPRNDMAFVANEVFQKLEFPLHQLDFSPTPADCS